MIYDPFYIAIMIIGSVLSFGASAWTKSAFKTWSSVPIQRGLTGAEVAAAILRAEGITSVRIEAVGGMLTDHYDPGARVLRLSPMVHDGRSVASAGVAAHEVGHALQHANGSILMGIRQRLVPVANIGTQMGVYIMIAGLIVGVTGLAKVGILLFSGFVAFTVITLPVELDASWKAGAALKQHKILEPSELRGVGVVLTAAATTYLAAAVSSILQLLYWAFRLGLLGGKRRE